MVVSLVGGGSRLDCAGLVAAAAAIPYGYFCNFFAARRAALRLDSPSMATFEEQLVEHRVYLMRFARLQLRNDAWAEDAVSETLLAALSKPQSFGNRSQLKTWLVGILKHKVIDLIRSNAREVSLPDRGADDEADELDKLAFQADGHFASPPRIGATRSRPWRKASFSRCSMPAWSACRRRWGVCS